MIKNRIIKDVSVIHEFHLIFTVRLVMVEGRRLPRKILDDKNNNNNLGLRRNARWPDLNSICANHLTSEPGHSG